MDDKRLEFVAMILAGEENILFYNKETVRKKTREASEAYDIMVGELGGSAPPSRSPRVGNCDDCSHIDVPLEQEPCASCFSRSKRHNWTPA